MPTNEALLGHGEKVAALAAGRTIVKEPGGRRQALGDITFTAIPLATEVFTINGTAFTMIANGGTPVGNQIALGTNLTTTIDAMVTALNASAVVGVAKATYSNVGGTKLHIVHDAYGAVGNTFTLVEAGSTASVAAATLTGGTDADTIDLKAGMYGLITTTGTTAQEWDLPAGEEGQEVAMYLKTKATGVNAKVNGAFVGGTSITFDTAGEFFKAKFMNASWALIANTGALA
jgi:hypothetical protein